MRTGGLWQLVAWSTVCLTLGRWLSQGVILFWWSSTSSVCLTILLLLAAVAIVALAVEDLLSEKVGLETWQLRSHWFVMVGALSLGFVVTVVQAIAYGVGV